MHGDHAHSQLQAHRMQLVAQRFHPGGKSRPADQSAVLPGLVQIAVVQVDELRPCSSEAGGLDRRRDLEHGALVHLAGHAPVRGEVEEDDLPPERRDALRPVHSFRDTAITRLVSAGVPLPVVQELAGHATIEMTRRYAEVSPKAVRQAVERVFG